MRFFASLAVALALIMPGMLLPASRAEAQARGHNDPGAFGLNSRIPRQRVLPMEPRNIWRTEELTRVHRNRSRELESVFSRCMWDRGNERALDFLSRTDFGFNRFEQIGMASQEAPDRFSFSTCLRRVAQRQNSGIILRFTAEAMRRWLVSEAYFASNPDGPVWAVPGNAIGQRGYPLSGQNPGVISAMDFVDCLVATDPQTADFYYRTAAESEDEANALTLLMPAISGCIPEGQQMELTHYAMRIWLGEGLWHASQHSSLATAETSQEAL